LASSACLSTVVRPRSERTWLVDSGSVGRWAVPSLAPFGRWGKQQRRPTKAGEGREKTCLSAVASLDWPPPPPSSRRPRPSPPRPPMTRSRQFPPALPARRGSHLRRAASLGLGLPFGRWTSCCRVSCAPVLGVWQRCTHIQYPCFYYVQNATDRDCSRFGSVTSLHWHSILFSTEPGGCCHPSRLSPVIL
jgi:hypothetical protein